MGEAHTTMRGHLVITPVDNGDEVSFEGLDGPLCKVATVIVGVAELVLNVFLCDGAAEDVRNFIVKALEDRRDASVLEAFVAFVITFDKVMGVVAADRFSKDGVGVVIVENKDVAHVAVGGDRNTTWEVRANKTLKVLPSKGSSAYLVVAVAMVSWWGEGGVFRKERGLALRGVDSLASAFHFSHDGWDGLGEVFANQVACEAWPGSEETSVNGLAECWDGWITGGGMEKGDKSGSLD